MTTKLISYSEALSILEDCDEKGVPKPFEIMFCTADRERGTGGDIIHYDKAIWHVKGGRKSDNPPVDGRKTRKRPNRKRRIRGFDTDQIRTLDAQLILYINRLSVR